MPYIPTTDPTWDDSDNNNSSLHPSVLDPTINGGAPDDARGNAYYDPNRPIPSLRSPFGAGEIMGDPTTGTPYEHDLSTTPVPDQNTNIEDYLRQKAGPNGFANKFEYQNALINGLKQIAAAHGQDINDDAHGSQWYAQNLQQGYKEMGKYLPDPVDPKMVKENANGDMINITNGKVIWKAPSLMSDLQDHAQTVDALHETASNIAQRNADLQAQGIKAPEVPLPPSNVSAIQPKTLQEKIKYLASDAGQSDLATLRGSKNIRDKGIVQQVDKNIAQQTKDAADNEKKGTDLDKTYHELVKKDLTQESSRTPVGVAVGSDTRVQKAETILSQSKITPQDMNMAMTDLSGIIQGGAPHEQEIKSQIYPTLQGKLAEMQQFITANPTQANSKPIVDKIKSLISDLHNVNQSVIDKHLISMEANFPKEIEHNKDSWTAYKKIWGSDKINNPVPTIKSQAEFDALPSGSVYLSTNGKPHKKP